MQIDAPVTRRADPRGARGMGRTWIAALALAATVLAGCVEAGYPGYDATPNPVGGLDLSARNGRAVGGSGGGGIGSTEVVYFDDTGVPQVVPPGVQALGTGYTVNLQGVSVDVAAKSLLTDVLGATYTIDPNAQGTVTMATGGPVPRDQLLKIFEEALKADGLVLVKQGDAFAILPGGGGMTTSMASEGYGLTALPLHHLGAQRMLTLLEGFAVPEGTIRAAASDDMLLIKGTAGDRAAVADLVMSLDTGVLAKPNAGIAFLKNASAAAVAADLAALAESDGSAAGWRVQVLDRSNALLVMARGQGDLKAAMNWIRKLDRGGGPTGGDVHVYQVQYAKASDLARLLSATFGGASGAAAPVAAADVTTLDQNGPPGSTALDGAGGDPTAGATPVAAIATGGGAGGGDVRFTPNDGDNTIIIRAPEPIRSQALSLLASLDRSPVQVLIDVMLVEVTLNDATSLGVQAYLQGANGSATVSNSTTGDIAGSFPGFNLVLGNGISPKVIIDSLSKVTKVKVVSAPSVVAFENEEAEIKVVEQVPIVTQQVTQTTSNDAPTVNSVEYKDAGVILRVTPQVSQSNLVNLQVLQELSAVVGTTDGTTTLTPTLRQRSITTRVAVYDQQTVVLGGLISQQTTNGKSSLFGLFPSHGDAANARTELVVFITPHVVRNQQDAASVSAELRAKMGLMANP